MAIDGGWRSPFFVKGVKYKVLKNWSHNGSIFIEGTIVEFESAGYERYDNESLFRFYERSDLSTNNQELIWSIHDEEPASKIHEYFIEHKNS